MQIWSEVQLKQPFIDDDYWATCVLKWINTSSLSKFRSNFRSCMFRLPRVIDMVNYGTNEKLPCLSEKFINGVNPRSLLVNKRENRISARKYYSQQGPSKGVHAPIFKYNRSSLPILRSKVLQTCAVPHLSKIVVTEIFLKIYIVIFRIFFQL